MSINKVKHPLTLLKFFVFNTDWGAREGFEHEKLIYYYSKTPTIGPDDQVSDIGLAEAMISFARQFGDVVESLHGSKQRFVVHRIEKSSIWAAICIVEPYSVRRSTDDSTQFVEYHDQEICSKFLSLKLENISNYFRLLNGPIGTLVKTLPREQFIERCVQFFDFYIAHLELLPFNLIELFGSIQYLPLNNTTFMTVQSLLNCVQAIDCRIHSYIFLYNDQLVTSLLSLDDTRIVYNYLTNVIIPDAVKDEINGIGQKTRWLLNDTRIYLSSARCFKHLCLFRSMNGSTIGLILDEHDPAILTDCEALLSSRLVNLTTKLQENVQLLSRNAADAKNGTISEVGVRFVYVNQTNSAQRSTDNCRKLVDSDFSRLILDLHDDLEDFGRGDVFELIGKNTNDAWLVVKNTDLRTLFVMLNHKNANLIETSEMVEQLRKKHLNSVFFGV